MNTKYESVVPDGLFLEHNLLFVNDIFFTLLNLG